MRIINQSGTYSLEFQDHDLRRQDNLIYAVANQRDILLGEYSDIKRAREVFTEIHDNAVKEMDILPGMIVFEMPKE